MNQVSRLAGVAGDILGIQSNRIRALEEMLAAADAMAHAWGVIYEAPHNEVIPAEQWPMMQAVSDYREARSALTAREESK